MTKPPSNAKQLPGLTLPAFGRTQPAPAPQKSAAPLSEEGVKKYIGQRLYKARELAGYTQRQAGEVVGVIPSTITNIEVGKHAASMRILIALAVLYGVEPGSLLPGLNSLD